MPLPRELNHQIVQLLVALQDLQDPQGRRALLLQAGLDSQLQQQILYNGPLGQFAQLLVATLDSYGTLATNQDALEAVLEAARNTVGSNKHAAYTAAISALRAFRGGHDAPPAGGSLAQEKRAALEARRADLLRKYRAANTQMTSMLSDVDKITVQNQIANIEREIHAIEAELAAL